jgi:hypothetical protein
MEVEPMSTHGRELLAFVQEIRTLSTQLADLLGAADKLMAEESWERATAQNIAHGSSSQSLDQPKKWFPYEVFRFYRQEEGHAIAFVSVLLDHDRKREYKIDEPLMTAGWFEFASTAPNVVPSDKLWWARFHGYMKDRCDDGTLMQVSPRRDWEAYYRADWYPFDRACSLGMPLAEITNTAQLQERVMKPLFTYMHDSPALLHA